MSSGRAAVAIRTAQEQDRGAIRSLTLTAYSEFEAVMEERAWSGLAHAVGFALDAWDGVDWIVAELEGQLVGSVALYPPAADAYDGAAERASWPELRLLSVAPEIRGRGVGRLLVEECARRAGAMGASDLGLHTSRSMASAIRLYERLGFLRAPEHDFQPEGAELVTAYRLPIG